MPAKDYSDTWFAVDGNNLLFPDVCMGDKTATNFTNRLQALNRVWNPQRIVVAFDPDDGSSFRRDIFPAYKQKPSGKKRDRPEGLDDALKAAQQACWDECVDCVSVPGFEADDVIATVVAGALSIGRRCAIFSSDKDLRQCLVAGSVSQCISLRLSRGDLETKWMTAADVLAEFKVRPNQWIDYQSMVGDTSDNYTGVAGIGKVGAVKLLNRYETLDQLIERETGNKWASKEALKVIATHESGTLDLMRTLATLRSDVPISEALLELEVAS